MSSDPAIPTFFQRMRRRKLVQWSLAYAAGAWLVLQILALLAQPFAWPDLVLRAAVVVLGVGFVAVPVLAWFHGEKGVQKAGGIELLMLGALFVVAASGVALVSRSGLPAGAGAELAVAPRPVPPDGASIAVLPFANLSADPENEYFSDGITEDVIATLSKIESLRVISRTSAMRYKESDLSTPAIAAELGVAHILEGSVRRAGNRIRIVAQLIRVDTDQHLWAETYDRELTDIFALQSEIAHAIARALDARLSRAENRRLAAVPATSPEAYESWVRGRAEYLVATNASIDRAIPHLEEAIRLDPVFAPATAYLARAYSIASRWNPLAADTAQALARRAIQLAPESPEGYSALGEVLREGGRYEEAVEQYRKALARDPNHSLSIAEMAETTGPYGLGRLDEALGWAERAIRADPRVGWYYTMVGDSYRQLGLHDRAAQAFDRGIRADPAYLSGYAYAVRLAAQVGDTATARGLADMALRLSPTPEVRQMLASAYYRGGDRDRATRFARELSPGEASTGVLFNRPLLHWLRDDRAAWARALADSEREIRRRLAQGNRWPWLPLYLAQAAAMRGDTAAVLEHLEGYVARGGRDEAFLTLDPLMAPFQDHPRFAAAVDVIRRDIAEQRQRVTATNAGP